MRHEVVPEHEAHEDIVVNPVFLLNSIQWLAVVHIKSDHVREFRDIHDVGFVGFKRRVNGFDEFRRFAKEEDARANGEMIDGEHDEVGV